MDTRAEGCLLGLAVGDALGRPVEFVGRDRLTGENRVTEMRANGTHGQPAGTITDDTEMALCIARSLDERGTFDPEDVARRFVAWYDSGPFDIGLMTADALREISKGAPPTEAGQQVWESRPEGSNAGNGSLMRCAPHAVAYADRPDRLTEVSRDSSAITHADPRCRDGCIALNRVLAALLTGASPSEALAGAGDGLDDDVRGVLASVGDPDPETLPNTGFVLHTLESALSLGLHAESFEDAVLDAVNMGGDADTTGAVTGAIAGARFGADAIPDRWTNTVDEAEELRTLARSLAAGNVA